ncbi:MAG: Uma2 family endonuclease [Acidobacteria bacterium]|nr:Uma2 family endonuclease [Acidobacteriota bacterium]
MSAETKPKYTLAEYLELDAKSAERLEYWQGEIFSMSGASAEHAEIEGNLMAFLKPQLTARGCRIFPADMRIKVPTMPPYRYGDLSALCDPAQFEEIGGVDALINPALIIEILSPSTEAYDRGDKFTHYKSIPSFCEYLLVAQHRPHLSQFVRQEDGSWLQREFNDLKDAVQLSTLGCELPLSAVYQNVFFAPTASVIPPAVQDDNV